MLLTVLFCGYCQGVFSSRRIAQAGETDIAFRVVSGGELLEEQRRREVRSEKIRAATA